MQNELKVLYQGEKGLITYEGKKIIFQHRNHRDGVKAGMGLIVDNKCFDKGKYAFAVFKNVHTVIPEQYKDIRFFANRGVPVKIEKGVYNDDILLKEYYQDKIYIRAYKEDGSIGLYESEYIKNENFSGKNMYYTRLNKGLVTWEDVTETLVKDIIDSIQFLQGHFDFNDETMKAALKGVLNNPIYQLESGVLVANGKFESLIFWTENEEIKMAWLGRKLDISSMKYKDVSEEILNILK